MQQLYILLQCTRWHQMRCNMMEVVTLLSTRHDLDFLEKGRNIDIYVYERMECWQELSQRLCQCNPRLHHHLPLGKWMGLLKMLSPSRVTSGTTTPALTWMWHTGDSGHQDLIEPPGASRKQPHTEMLLWLLNLSAVIMHIQVMQI